MMLILFFLPSAPFIIFSYLTFREAAEKITENAKEVPDTKKRIIIALILLASAGLYFALPPEQVQSLLAGLGRWGPWAYMAMFAVLPAFFFPVAVLALAGGLLFGLWRGALYTFLGAIVNCTLMFWLARTLGREQVSRLMEEKLDPKWRTRLSTLEGKKGFTLLIVLRLIPAVPYNLINYAFGLTGMRYPAYILGSALGIIPGTFAFINIGDKALDVTSPGFLAAIGLLLLLLAVTAALGKRLFPDT